ncbi:MAG TPA: NAD(P)-dependent oxidoreductase [Armatimonadota bacterium]|nr:NAD(P)-dependent oxidoreductase [Armatimonadota bacterium]
MNIAVFGAAGWLGRAILDNLQGRHTVRAFDRSPEAWDAWADIDGAWDGERVHGDISDFRTVDAALEGMDGVIHAAAYFGQDDDDPLPWMINLKGLWNVLEAARRREIRHVVHVGSRETVHPLGVFFDASIRRPGGGVYPLTKRLQEEMCRSFHDAHGMRILVLCPDYIVDSRLGLGRFREKLGPEGTPLRNGWVCRHDLAEACRLAVENETLEFDIFHIVGTPEADRTCNVARSREVLGLTYRGDLEQYRAR